MPALPPPPPPPGMAEATAGGFSPIPSLAFCRLESGRGDAGCSQQVPASPGQPENLEVSVCGGWGGVWAAPRQCPVMGWLSDAICPCSLWSTGLTDCMLPALGTMVASCSQLW